MHSGLALFINCWKQAFPQVFESRRIFFQFARPENPWKETRSSKRLWIIAKSPWMFILMTCVSYSTAPVWGRGTHVSPTVYLIPHLFPFYFSLSFIGFTYFLLLSIPSLSTRIVLLCFQAGGHKRRLNLGFVCCVYLCYLYSLVEMDSGVLFYLV